MQSERKKTLSRWDESIHEKSPAQTVSNPRKYDDFLSTNSLQLNRFSAQSKTLLHHLSVDNTSVQEFLPRTADDPVLSILRELFIHSLLEFYKEIEIQLKLKTDKSLPEWLNETFDDTQEEVLNRRQRCFILCSNDETTKTDRKQRMIGFLTLTEEEKGSVYISQIAIDAENKRRGYGTHLLQHLRAIYPPGTFYWGLCRRVNQPAVKFYLRHGAKFIEDEEAAIKYGYNPELYTGFQFIDGLPIHTQSK